MPVDDELCETCANDICHCRKCYGRPSIRNSCSTCGYTYKGPTGNCSAYYPKELEMETRPKPIKEIEVTVDENIAIW